MGKTNECGIELGSPPNANVFSDFMDALCDPRAFLSAQEKRAEQLKALGIEENDISGDVIQSKAGDKKGDAKGDGKGGKKEEKKGKSLEWLLFQLLF